LTRELLIKRITLYNIITDVLYTIVTIGCAYWLHNVWALVWGYLASSIFKLIGSFIIAPYKPRFDFDWIKMKGLWSFGKWILISGVFLTLFRHGDDLFVGKLLGVTALGYYAMAYKLGNLITTELVDAVRKVLFPAFAALQNDLLRLRKSFLISYQMTVAVGFLFSLGLALLSPEFILFALGEKWTPIIPTLRVLAIWGGFQMLSTTMVPLFRAVGKPDWWAKVQIFKVIILAILIYPFSIYWNIMGTSIAVLIAAILEVPIGLNFAQRVLHCAWRDILMPLWMPGISSIIVGVLYLLTYPVLSLSPLAHLLVFGSGIVIFYGLVLMIMDTQTKVGYWSNLKKMLVK
ncbi:MAG: oligosaccharide flippase family protein, partial [Anaerolineae bacterium]|nr:oligosaccharide flippase family protein [Anaerolineae bacterium]